MKLSSNKSIENQSLGKNLTKSLYQSSDGSSFNYIASAKTDTTKDPLPLSPPINTTLQIETNYNQGKQVHEITIIDFEFHPKRLRVAANSTVRWIIGENKVTHQSGIYAPGSRSFVIIIEVLDIESDLLSKGESFEYCFKRPGTYEVKCSNYPRIRGIVETYEAGKEPDLETIKEKEYRNRGLFQNDRDIEDHFERMRSASPPIRKTIDPIVPTPEDMQSHYIQELIKDLSAQSHSKSKNILERSHDVLPEKEKSLNLMSRINFSSSQLGHSESFEYQETFFEDNIALSDFEYEKGYELSMRSESADLKNNSPTIVFPLISEEIKTEANKETRKETMQQINLNLGAETINKKETDPIDNKQKDSNETMKNNGMELKEEKESLESKQTLEKENSKEKKKKKKSKSKKKKKKTNEQDDKDQEKVPLSENGDQKKEQENQNSKEDVIKIENKVVFEERELKPIEHVGTQKKQPEIILNKSHKEKGGDNNNRNMIDDNTDNYKEIAESIQTNGNKKKKKEKTKKRKDKPVVIEEEIKNTKLLKKHSSEIAKEDNERKKEIKEEQKDVIFKPQKQNVILDKEIDHAVNSSTEDFFSFIKKCTSEYVTKNKTKFRNNKKSMTCITQNGLSEELEKITVLKNFLMNSKIKI